MTDYKLVPVEPTDDELIAWAGEEQFFLFCDKDDFLDIARSVLQRYAGRSPDVRGEPVATIHVDGSFVHVAWRNPAPSRCAMDVYTAPQPTPDVSALVEALEELSTAWRALQSENDGVYQDAIAALSAYREQQGGEP